MGAVDQGLGAVEFDAGDEHLDVGAQGEGVAFGAQSDRGAHEGVGGVDAQFLGLAVDAVFEGLGSSCLEGFMMIQGRGRPRVGSSTEAGTSRAWRRRCRRLRAVARRATPIAPAPAEAASAQ